MTHSALKHIFIAASMLAVSSPALADNIAACELVLMEEILDESGQGGGAVASYRPAADFLADVYTDGAEVKKDIDGAKIRAVMCARSNIIPTKADFKILVTGIPFVLSQNYDAQDSDLLTYYFKDGEFRYQYKGPGLIDETQADLEKRVAYFNAQDHDLGGATSPEDSAGEDNAEEDNADEDNVGEDTPKQNKPSMEKPLEVD